MDSTAQHCRDVPRGQLPPGTLPTLPSTRCPLHNCSSPIFHCPLACRTTTYICQQHSNDIPSSERPLRLPILRCCCCCCCTRLHTRKAEPCLGEHLPHQRLRPLAPPSTTPLHHDHQRQSRRASRRPFPASAAHCALRWLHVARRPLRPGARPLHRHVRRAQRRLPRPRRHPRRHRHVQIPLQALTRRVLRRAAPTAHREPHHAAVLGGHSDVGPAGNVCGAADDERDERVHDDTGAAAEEPARGGRHHSQRRPHYQLCEVRHRPRVEPAAHGRQAGHERAADARGAGRLHAERARARRGAAHIPAARRRHHSVLLRRHSEAAGKDDGGGGARARRVQRQRRVRHGHLHVPAVPHLRAAGRRAVRAAGRRGHDCVLPQGGPQPGRGHEVQSVQRAQATAGRRHRRQLLQADRGHRRHTRRAVPGQHTPHSLHSALRSSRRHRAQPRTDRVGVLEAVRK